MRFTHPKGIKFCTTSFFLWPSDIIVGCTNQFRAFRSPDHSSVSRAEYATWHLHCTAYGMLNEIDPRMTMQRYGFDSCGNRNNGKYGLLHDRVSDGGCNSLFQQRISVVSVFLEASFYSCWCHAGKSLLMLFVSLRCCLAMLGRLLLCRLCIFMHADAVLPRIVFKGIAQPLKCR